MEHYYLKNNGYKKNTTHILCSKYTHPPDLAQLVEHLTVVVNTNMYFKDIEGSPVRIR